MNKSAHEIWQEKASPLWLLQASRSLAQYPSADAISLDAVNLYLKRFAFDISEDPRKREFSEIIPPSHRQLFTYLTEESRDYYNVFKGAYGVELLEQASHSISKDYLTHLNPDHLESHVVHNLLIATSIAFIREMAVIEYSLKHGEINEQEHTFALSDLQQRMDRLGINGVDKLLASRPELEEFLRHDTTVINVGHIPSEAHNATRTRAAAYADIEAFKRSPSTRDLITAFRQHLISPTFRKRTDQMDQYLRLHAPSMEEPADEDRRKYEGCGVVMGGGSGSTEAHHVAMLEQIATEMQAGSDTKLKKYTNFLLHDGIAINHPNKSRVIAELRAKMLGVVSDTGPSQNSVPAIEPNPDTPSEDIPTRAISLDDGHIEDAVIIRETPSDRADASNHVKPEGEVTEVTALPPSSTTENKAATPEIDSGPTQSPKVPARHGKSSSGTNDMPTHTQDAKESNTAAKIAAIGGTAAALGILLTKGSGNKGSDNKKESTRASDQEEPSGLGRKIAFAVATTVAVGGAVAWARKPEFLAKPLQKLIALFTDKPGPHLKS